MNSKIFRGALVGCGFFAANHMNAWSGLASANIAALCDSNAERLASMAKKFGVTSTYANMKDMLSIEKLDFVDVATTVQSHRTLVEEAAPHVKLVICQKPFAENFADAQAMVSTCAANGTALLIHENFRWQHGYILMKKLLDDGEIGTLRFAQFSFRHGYDNYVNQPYLAEIERFAIMDVGLHLFDLARWVMGEVKQLSCVTQRRNPKVRGEDFFTAQFLHESGAISICDCSFASIFEPEPFPQVLALVEGDLGTLVLDRDYKLSLHRPGKVETRLVEPKAPSWGAKPWHVVQDSVINLENHALDVLRGIAEPQPSGADNLKTLALALAAYESAEQGKTITMADWSEKTS